MPFSVFYNRRCVWNLECGLPLLKLCWLAFVTTEGPETGTPFSAIFSYLCTVHWFQCYSKTINDRLVVVLETWGDILMVYNS